MDPSSPISDTSLSPKKKFGPVEILLIVVFFLSIIIAMAFGTSSSDPKKTKQEKLVNNSAITYFIVLSILSAFLFIYKLNLLKSRSGVATILYFLLCIIFTLVGGISGSEAQAKNEVDRNAVDSDDKSLSKSKQQIIQEKTANGWKSATFITLAFGFGIPVIYYINKTIGVEID